MVDGFNKLDGCGWHVVVNWEQGAEDGLHGPNALRVMDHFDGIGKHRLGWLWVPPSVCVQMGKVVEEASPAPKIPSV